MVGSRTPPVEEAITHGQNGLLVDFFDVAGLAHQVSDCLAAPERYAHLRVAALRTAVERYVLATICLPQQVRRVEELARQETPARR